MTGRLLLVPSPLDFGVPAGQSAPDLQDMLPLGVIRIAARLHYWVAENAKTTRAFLKRVEQVAALSQPLQALSIVELPRAPKGRPLSESAGLLDRLLAPLHQGHDMGLISEAGLPAVADPGAELVRAAHDTGIEVVALPGASSLALSLAASGLNGQSFAFVGYLPVDAAARARRIRELEDLSRRIGQTQLMIETPYRNAALLGALVDHLGAGTRLSVSCALTLASGWTRTSTVAQWRTKGTSMPADMPAVFAFLAG
jgi:16S rRNA (cytidine1402-2'-O)-methyltransferase